MQAYVLWISIFRQTPDFGLLGEAKFSKMCHSLPWMPMNRRAKHDSAIALSSAEKSVTVQTHTKTNSNPYIHTLHIGVCE